jgi:REP element-mobilizing transposase RayT
LFSVQNKNDLDLCIVETSHPYFFTATILNWKHLLKPDKYKQILTDSLQFLVENKRVKIYAFVVMPNHIHIIWQMVNNHRKEDVQRDFLKFAAQKIKFDLIENHQNILEMFKVNQKGRNYQFWQNRPLWIELFSESVFEQKLDYIHNNPIQEKWKLSLYPEDYLFSSAGFYFKGESKWAFLTHYKE